MIRVIILVIAMCACGFFALQMPWAELDMDSSNEAIPHTLKLAKLDGVAQKAFEPLEAQKAKYNEALSAKKAEGKHGDYVYAWALGLALLAGAIGIMAIGSEDEQEKTVLAQK